MAYDQARAEEMRTALKKRKNVTEQAMFGGICWMMDGHMLCGTSDQRFMFRVGKEAQADALKRPGASAMQFGERRMGGLVWVEADAAKKEGLETWINRAAAFTTSLPPKKGRKK